MWLHSDIIERAGETNASLMSTMTTVVIAANAAVAAVVAADYNLTHLALSSDRLHHRHTVDHALSGRRSHASAQLPEADQRSPQPGLDPERTVEVR